MKKLLLITLAAAMLLSGCGPKTNKDSSAAKNDDPYGLTITAKDVSSTGLKLVYEQKDVEYEGELKVSGRYMIETPGEQDSWEEVEITGSFGQAGDTYHPINKNKVTEFDHNWENIYGVLPKGKYRIHLFMRHYITEDSINKAEYFIPFEIK